MGAATTAPESAREQEKPKGIVARCRTLLALAFGYFIDQGEAQAMRCCFRR